MGPATRETKVPDPPAKLLEKGLSGARADENRVATGGRRVAADEHRAAGDEHRGPADEHRLRATQSRAALI